MIVEPTRFRTSIHACRSACGRRGQRHLPGVELSTRCALLTRTAQPPGQAEPPATRQTLRRRQVTRRRWTAHRRAVFDILSSSENFRSVQQLYRQVRQQKSQRSSTPIRQPSPGPVTPAAPSGRRDLAAPTVENHLATLGFSGAPHVLSLDDSGLETLEFVVGHVGHLSGEEPLPEWFRAPEACR
jgi:hypothetical protein